MFDPCGYEICVPTCLPVCPPAYCPPPRYPRRYPRRPHWMTRSTFREKPPVHRSRPQRCVEDQCVENQYSCDRSCVQIQSCVAPPDCVAAACVAPVECATPVACVAPMNRNVCVTYEDHSGQNWKPSNSDELPVPTPPDPTTGARFNEEDAELKIKPEETVVEEPVVVEEPKPVIEPPKVNPPTPKAK
ncbi:MAG: hypothetical protein KDA78_18005, partial [Planctomycetaceae bacterium]|nr:hypothetical protein [Planctomycetaceae bacterium]